MVPESGCCVAVAGFSYDWEERASGCHQQLIIQSSSPHLTVMSAANQHINLLLLKSLNAIRLPSVLECVNRDEAQVQYVKNKNKSVGARQAGSGHKRLKQNSCAQPRQTERGSKGSDGAREKKKKSNVRPGRPLWTSVITLCTQTG